MIISFPNCVLHLHKPNINYRYTQSKEFSLSRPGRRHRRKRLSRRPYRSSHTHTTTHSSSVLRFSLSRFICVKWVKLCTYLWKRYSNTIAHTRAYAPIYTHIPASLAVPWLQDLSAREQPTNPAATQAATTETEIERRISKRCSTYCCCSSHTPLYIAVLVGTDHGVY